MSTATHILVPKVGEPAPDFQGEAVIDNDFKVIKLSDYKGKWLVFYFYPLDFTFVCPTEIIAFSEHIAKFKAIGCEVVGCSVDSKYTHFAWCQTPRKAGGLGQIAYPLLEDVNKEISVKYGALLGNTGYTLRATYIIDPKGILRHVSFNDPPVGRSIPEVLRLVSGYQYTDKNGEVCPADWHDGDKTIKEDPIKKLQFFEKTY